jgi:hypothetical protein
LDKRWGRPNDIESVKMGLGDIMDALEAHAQVGPAAQAAAPGMDFIIRVLPNDFSASPAFFRKFR